MNNSRQWTAVASFGSQYLDIELGIVALGDSELGGTAGIVRMVDATTLIGEQVLYRRDKNGIVVCRAIETRIGTVRIRTTGARN